MIKTLADVLEVAVRVERSGIKYYQHLQQLADSQPVKDMFVRLAAAEAKHLEVFNTLLKKVAPYEVVFKYAGSYEEFLQDMAFISHDTFAHSIFITRAEAGIDIALGMENESILFYTGLLKSFDEAGQKTIRLIIEEEKGHVEVLESFKLGGEQPGP
jgi:rubrerythrin